jgi:hypothetical protein
MHFVVANRQSKLHISISSNLFIIKVVDAPGFIKNENCA